jgi:uncharacterized protein
MNFFCKLIPPRPSFAQDMTEAEGRLMQEHATYWRAWMDRGNIIAFGVVADPSGVFGAGMVDFESLEAVEAFTAGDPTIQSQSGFAFEVHPMPFGVVHP